MPSLTSLAAAAMRKPSPKRIVLDMRPVMVHQASPFFASVRRAIRFCWARGGTAKRVIETLKET